MRHPSPAVIGALAMMDALGVDPPELRNVDNALRSPAAAASTSTPNRPPERKRARINAGRAKLIAKAERSRLRSEAARRASR